MVGKSNIIINLLNYFSNRPGSVIANFTIYYSGFDSYQFVLLQDSIDVDHSIGKLDIMPYPSQYAIGPNGNYHIFCSLFVLKILTLEILNKIFEITPSIAISGFDSLGKYIFFNRPFPISKKYIKLTFSVETLPSFYVTMFFQSIVKVNFKNILF